MFGGYHQTLPPFMTAAEPSVTLTTTYKAIIPTTRYTQKLGTGWFDLFAGRRLRMRAAGTLVTSTSAGNLQVGVLWGTNADANGTNIGQSAAKALTSSIATPATWLLDLIIASHANVSGSGTNGKLICSGKFEIDGAIVANSLQPIIIPSASLAEVTGLDLTGTLVPSIQMLASAGASIACVVQDFQIDENN
jgi:hypothetical protein